MPFECTPFAVWFVIDQGGRPFDVWGADDVDVTEVGKYGGGGTRDAESTVKTSMPEKKFQDVLTTFWNVMKKIDL